MILYLDSLRSIRRRSLPGRLLSGMALGRFRAIGAGYVPAVLPLAGDVNAVMRGRISARTYRTRLEARYQWWGQEMSRPAVISAVDNALLGTVQNGDTIVCACPRRGDPARRHPFCHLEVVAPYLMTPGVTLVLYGQAVAS